MYHSSRNRENGSKGNSEITRAATPNTNPEGKADSSLISEGIATLVSACQAASVKSHRSKATTETHVVRAQQRATKSISFCPSKQTDIICMCLSMYV